MIYYTLESIGEAQNITKDAKRERERLKTDTQASCSLSVAIKSENVKVDKEAENPPKTTKERAKESDIKENRRRNKRERRENKRTHTPPPNRLMIGVLKLHPSVRRDHGSP